MMRLKVTKLKAYGQTAIHTTGGAGNDYNVLNVITAEKEARNTVSQLPDGAYHDHLPEATTAPPELKPFTLQLRVGRATSSRENIEASVIALYNRLGLSCTVTAVLLENGDTYTCDTRILKIRDKTTRTAFKKRHLIDLTFQPLNDWEFTL